MLSQTAIRMLILLFRFPGHYRRQLINKLGSLAGCAMSLASLPNITGNDAKLASHKKCLQVQLFYASHICTICLANF